MPLSEALFGSALVLVLVILAAGFGWRQARRLRDLRGQSLPEDEMRWERRKAWRRLASAILLCLMAALLVGQLLWLEPAAQRLIDEREQFAEQDKPPYSAEQKVVIRLWGWAWVAILTLLLSVVTLAGFDLWATRLYGWKQFRKIEADRRAMVERQAARLRHGRNGHG